VFLNTSEEKMSSEDEESVEAHLKEQKVWAEEKYLRNFMDDDDWIKLLDDLRSKQGIADLVFEMSFDFKRYSNVFKVEDLLTWLSKRKEIHKEEDAIKLASALLRRGAIIPFPPNSGVGDDLILKESDAYYRYVDKDKADQEFSVSFLLEYLLMFVKASEHFMFPEVWLRRLKDPWRGVPKEAVKRKLTKYEHSFEGESLITWFKAAHVDFSSRDQAVKYCQFLLSEGFIERCDAKSADGWNSSGVYRFAGTEPAVDALKQEGKFRMSCCSPNLSSFLKTCANDSDLLIGLLTQLQKYKEHQEMCELSEKKTAFEDTTRLVSLFWLLIDYTPKFWNDVLEIYKFSNPDVASLLLELKWHEIRRKLCANHEFSIEISDSNCETCSAVDEEFAGFITTYCARKFSNKVKRSILAIICDETFVPEKFPSFNQTIRRPRLLKTLFSLTLHARVDLQVSTMTDINALLIHNVANARTILNCDDWSKELVQLLSFHCKDTEVKKLVLHVFVLLTQHSMFDSAQFSSTLDRIIKDFQLFGVPFSPQSRLAAGLFLRALVAKIGHLKMKFPATMSDESLACTNLEKLLRITRVFLFRTAKWGQKGMKHKDMVIFSVDQDDSSQVGLHVDHKTGQVDVESVRETVEKVLVILNWFKEEDLAMLEFAPGDKAKKEKFLLSMVREKKFWLDAAEMLGAIQEQNPEEKAVSDMVRYLLGVGSRFGA